MGIFWKRKSFSRRLLLEFCSWPARYYKVLRDEAREERTNCCRTDCSRRIQSRVNGKNKRRTILPRKVSAEKNTQGQIFHIEALSSAGMEVSGRIREFARGSAGEQLNLLTNLLTNFSWIVIFGTLTITDICPQTTTNWKNQPRNRSIDRSISTIEHKDSLLLPKCIVVPRNSIVQEYRKSTPRSCWGSKRLDRIECKRWVGGCPHEILPWKVCGCNRFVTFPLRRRGIFVCRNDPKRRVHCDRCCCRTNLWRCRRSQKWLATHAFGPQHHHEQSGEIETQQPTTKMMGEKGGEEPYASNTKLLQDHGCSLSTYHGRILAASEASCGEKGSCKRKKYWSDHHHHSGLVGGAMIWSDKDSGSLTTSYTISSIVRVVR